ncbi:PilZ domain-containing protein [Endozoicomonas sp. SM1973]|uniref:PilZ domain-containing protein n=1 Tax=Spartinivicinus marinus TaxID=2994442 RepID=A0A853I4C1_9GAMM|nr:PilZ domain-containing protein [Spartinivicinus marinus]MCX4029945.1 PilZ domain-containing protein [Spartinivicinus marinus]NYZ64811.1 PilZ domain-containing protein [Spartinivicinus marinus]
MDSFLFNQDNRAPRKKTKWNAALKVKEAVIPVELLDISEQGALVSSSLNVNKSKSIALMIKAKYDKYRSVIYARALVRHVTMRKNNFYIGLQFIAIDKHHQQFIKNYLEHNELGI